MGEDEMRIKEARQALKFINWRIERLKKTNPSAYISIKILCNAGEEIEAFIEYDEDGNRRKKARTKP